MAYTVIGLPVACALLLAMQLSDMLRYAVRLLLFATPSLFTSVDNWPDGHRYFCVLVHRPQFVCIVRARQPAHIAPLQYRSYNRSKLVSVSLFCQLHQSAYIFYTL